MNLFKSIGDRLLTMFIPAVKAGACVPEVGQVCATLRYKCNGTCA